MAVLVILLYLICLLFLFLFSLGQLHLAWHYRKGLKEDEGTDMPVLPEEAPFITIQLPLYNERYVAERLLEAVCAFDYSTERMEIQVLDDSTDDTQEIVARKISELQHCGIRIHHICRRNREGFKAGALQAGLQQARGEFIAIFDADFLPSPDFLRKTVPWFADPQTGVVQTRWGHLNRNYSLLTRLQAFGLDAHFTVEQGGRSHAGSFINFNGTGGIWRKSCIEDAGGWSADTLTEDLDLSYRAQLKGWHFRYLEGVEAPAELPVLMPAIKSQHFRWNKGAAECARKNLGKVFRSEEPMIHKIHGLFHLLNSSIFLVIFLAALLSIPVLFIKENNPQQLDWIFQAGGIFLLGFFSIALFYWTSSRRLQPQHTSRYFWSLFPPFLVMSMGLAAHNTIAVTEGWLGKKSAFMRTPKFNIRQKGERWQDNVYIRQKLSWLSLLEGLLCLYFLFGIGAGIYLQDYGLIIFHTMLAAGFGAVFYYSVR
jgi:cellulose synthase/poly-beta-1,6-N-acetylglucosamine synthase-like glycosyltransferase